MVDIKTNCLHPVGTTGLGWPVEVSQSIALLLFPNRISSNQRPDMAVWYVCISESFPGL